MFRYLRSSMKYMAAAVLLNIAFACMNVLYTDVFRRYFNEVQNGQTQELMVFVLSLITVEGLMTVTHFVSAFLTNKLRRKTTRRMQEDLFSRILDAMSVDIEKKPIGELSTLIRDDVSTVASSVSAVSVRLVHLIIRFALYAGYLMFLNWQMALITLTIGPMMLLAGRLFTPWMEKKGEKLRTDETANEESLQSAFGALSFIKLNSLRGYVLRRFGRTWDAKEKSDDANSAVDVLYDELSSFLGVVGSIFILGVAAVLLARGHLMVGTVVAYLQLHNEIVWPFIEMSALWGQVVQGKVSYKRIQQAMDIRMENGAEEGVLTDVGRIEVKNVCFSYTDGHPVLKDVSFTANKGEVVCLLGDNGAGKSTLLRLIGGLYLPDTGSIALDDIPLTAENMKRIRSAYGYVMQNEHVFDGTIRENLTFEKPYSSARLEEAAEITGLSQYVKTLEEGYETKLVNGSLSGGELKKLSLTRLLLADRPVFVLDEPFAHLDKEGCDRLVSLIQTMKKDKIIFLITHKKEMTQYADRTICLRDGRIG